jgi:hypothetical protein
MKVLIIGVEKDYNAEYFYAKAFEQLGHEVSIINEYKGVNNPTRTRILYTRFGLFHFNWRHFEINKNIIEKVRSIEPDMILVFKGELLSTLNIAKLNENFKIYLFYPDMYKFRQILKNRLRYFQAIFTAANETQFYYDLGAKRVVTTPWGCDPEFHIKKIEEKKYDVSFVGTGYLERRKIIGKLNNVTTFGDFWPRGRNHNPPLYGIEYINVINQTKINLNLQAKANIVADAPTMRTFEIAGCGGFQISDYMPSLKRYFPMLPTFNDIDELKDLIFHYLENPKETEEIALRTMEICHSSFKYIDAAKTIISGL